MKSYTVKVTAYANYPFDRTLIIQENDYHTACSRAIKEFFEDKVNKKRKRKIKQITIIIKR